MKKAQGISLSVIIIAAIALIVLIVLVAIFTGKIGSFSDSYSNTTQSATSKVCGSQGYCLEGSGSCRAGYNPVSRDDWLDCGGTICCVEV